MYFNADIKWVTVLYDKNGVELARVPIQDKSSIWAWSPLFLFNGFHMVRDLAEVAAPATSNALMNVLSSTATVRK